ncbi:hypothetical protein ACIP5T_03110 [Microbacterium sp. NPDC088619]
MTALNLPDSTATVDVPEELVERYEKAGWMRVEKPKPKTTAKK